MSTARANLGIAGRDVSKPANVLRGAEAQLETRPARGRTGPQSGWQDPAGGNGPTFGTSRSFRHNLQ